jgi:hypothetical protein
MAILIHSREKPDRPCLILYTAVSYFSQYVYNLFAVRWISIVKLGRCWVATDPVQLHGYASLPLNKWVKGVKTALMLHTDGQ